METLLPYAAAIVTLFGFALTVAGYITQECRTQTGRPRPDPDILLIEMRAWEARFTARHGGLPKSVVWRPDLLPKIDRSLIGPASRADPKLMNPQQRIVFTDTYTYKR